MEFQFSQACPQTKRALRMLLSPKAKRINQKALIDSLHGKTPSDPKDLIDLVIQIVLALLDNKEGDKPEKPDEPDDEFATLAMIATKAAIDTIQLSVLQHDVPKLTPAIRSVAAMIPFANFSSLRNAREAMRCANNAALGESAHNWSTWNTAIRNAMEACDDNGQLENLLDYRDAWLAIADALDTTI